MPRKRLPCGFIFLNEIFMIFFLTDTNSDVRKKKAKTFVEVRLIEAQPDAGSDGYPAGNI